MSEPSAFDRKQVEAQAHVQPEGLLDHLNLPPGFVRFVRKNQRSLQISAIILAVVVVTGSLYDSYRSSRLDKAAVALAAALQLDETEQDAALAQVNEDFSGTPSAHWARIELGHKALAAEEYQQAVEQYQAVRAEVAKSSPLQPLLTFGLAQAQERLANWEAAMTEYRALQQVDGFKGLGYQGVATVFQAQGEANRALAVYEEYAALLASQGGDVTELRDIEERISRMKAVQ